MKPIEKLLQPSVQLARKFLSKLPQPEAREIALILCILSLALLVLSCAGCTQSSQPSAVIPPLSTEARQPPAVDECSPDCLTKWRELQESMRLRLLDLE